MSSGIINLPSDITIRRYALKKISNKKNNIFSIIVVILLIGVLVFSTIKVIKYIVDNKQNKKIEEEISNFVEYVE